MIILLYPFGQTSNQFFQHVHLDAFCREYNILFYNPSFHLYKKDYPKLKLFCHNFFIYKFFRLIFKIRQKLNLLEVVDFDNDDNVRYYSQNAKRFKWNIVFCSGWRFRRADLVEKYREDYQRQFRPDIDIKKLEADFLKRDFIGQILMGVHIRRGDYKEYAGGKFYFEDDIYINYINQLLNLLNSDCKIILFTDDSSFNFQIYKDRFSNVCLSQCSVVEDHYLMSKCDYLLGAFSTFSLWASYIGGAKLYRVRDKNEILTLDKFVDSPYV